jgi:hypothetical protein
MNARSSLSRLALAGALAGLSALTTGCAEDLEVDLNARTTAPLPVALSSRSVAVPAGVAVGVNAIPLSNGDEMDEETTVELISENIQVLGVDRTIEDRSFVFYGVGPGTTDVRVYIDGSFAGTIAATVQLQRDELR